MFRACPGAGEHSYVASDLAHVDKIKTPDVGDRRDAGVDQGIRAGAEQRRGQVGDHPVDEARLDHRTGQTRPSLQQHVPAFPGVQLVHQGGEVEGIGPLAPGNHPHLVARRDPGGCVVPPDLRVLRGTAPGVRDHPQRLPGPGSAVRVAHGQQRVVGQHRAHTDQHGVHLRP
ncbi:hypothetical protein Kisp02_47340 [Kineosporia sp. NBRC 101731]|nr:hypothetical protein Kisp02_47340 [Kineosporia sp. NBRC 101731]